jgi:hypothetical protein
MAEFAVFARARSPITTGLVDRAVDDVEAQTLRHGILQGATTIAEVISLIPADYRWTLSEPLNGVAVTAEKLFSAKATLAKWQQHQAAGTHPTKLRAKAPVMQMTARYKSEDEATQHIRALEAAHVKYLQDQLAGMISAKTSEIMFLERSLSPTDLFGEMIPLIHARSDQLKKLHRVPVFSTSANRAPETMEWVESINQSRLYKRLGAM